MTPGDRPSCWQVATVANLGWARTDLRWSVHQDHSVLKAGGRDYNWSCRAPPMSEGMIGKGAGQIARDERANEMRRRAWALVKGRGTGHEAGLLEYTNVGMAIFSIAFSPRAIVSASVRKQARCSLRSGGTAAVPSSCTSRGCGKHDLNI
jgi:hypothetical protein